MDQNIKDPQPVLTVSSKVQQAKLNSLEQTLQNAKSELATMLVDYEYADTVAAADEKKEDQSTRTVEKYTWLDDELPVGAKPELKWEFITSDTGPVYSGETSRVASADDRMVQHLFKGAAPLRVQSGDRFFAMVYLDPADPPSEIMLQFNDGTWEHRVFWGQDKISWGTSGESSRFLGGELPATGLWVELEIPVDEVGFANLSLINGIAFTQWGGTAYWDAAGVYTSLEQTGEFTSLSGWLEWVRLSKGEGLPNPIKELVEIPQEELNGDQLKTTREYFLQNIHPEARKELAKYVKQVDAASKEVEEYKKSLTTTLISRENEQAKPAFLLLRGEYDQKGEQVQRATPAALPSFPESAPQNRLGFARWLVSTENPLTARVAVNRFWQQVFGTGIVRTADDFGPGRRSQPSWFIGLVGGGLHEQRLGYQTTDEDDGHVFNLSPVVTFDSRAGHSGSRQSTARAWSKIPLGC